jgi:hypothetical protein
MNAATSLRRLISMPTPDALWEFKESLNVDGLPDDSPLMIITDRFHTFLNELVARSTAREYSHFASLLDMAAVAGVAVENLISGKEDSDFWKRFGLAAISETMMVMAARQYVKAWEVEMAASYNSASWFLSQEFWRLSKELQPDMLDEQRRGLVKELLDPIQDVEVKGVVKAGVIVRLFQLLLLHRYLLFRQQA